MGKRVTIQQIAEMAGVSRGTVDRVLNHRSYVSEAVRARVEAAVAETGYISPREAYRREQDGAVRPLTLGILLPNWTGQFQEEVQEGIRHAEQELAPQHVRILQRRCRTELPQESVELLDEMVREGGRALHLRPQRPLHLQAGGGTGGCRYPLRHLQLRSAEKPAALLCGAGPLSGRADGR